MQACENFLHKTNYILLERLYQAIAANIEHLTQTNPNDKSYCTLINSRLKKTCMSVIRSLQTHSLAVSLDSGALMFDCGSKKNNWHRSRS